MWRASFFLLCLAAGSRQFSMSEFSVPSAVETGEEAELHCKYELQKNESEKAIYVKWWWMPLNNTNSERFQLYQRIAGYDAKAFNRHHDNIEILENDGLKLTNVTPTQSGVYECEVSVSNIKEIRQHGKMIVFSIGSGPLLNVTVDDENKQMDALVTCEAFDVAPRPDIVITLNGEKIESSGYVTELDDGLYAIYENATLTMDKADKGEFTCEIFFEDDVVPPVSNIVSQVFEAPTASTPEPEEPDTEPSAATPQPSDSGSNRIGGSWMWLTSFFSLILLLDDLNK